MKSRKNGVAVGLVFAGLSLTSVTAFAEDSVVNTQTSSSSAEKSFYDTLLEKGALNYWGYYTGASINNLGNGYQPNVDGSNGSPQSIESIITAGYKFTPTLMVGVTPHFNFLPALGPDSWGSGHIQMLDPSVFIQQTNFAVVRGVKFTGILFGTPAMAARDKLKRDGNAFAFTPTLINSYTVPSTQLTLGLFSFLRFYIPGSDTPDTTNTYRIVVCPNATYQLSKTVTATLWVDLVSAYRRGGTHYFGGLDLGPTDIQPGINWAITPNVSINPQLNIYPSNMTIASTSFQAILTAKAL